MTDKQFYKRTYAQADERLLQWRKLGGTMKAQNIRDIVGDRPVHTVLDIGSGTGAVLASLAPMGWGAQYWAIDIVEEAVALVRQRDDIPGLVEAQLFDGQHIPYQDQQFDLAILSHVVEHLADPAPLLREAARVARLVAVEVPLEANLYTYLKVHLFRSRYREEIGHIQWFSQRTFKSLLGRTCGLAIMDMRMVYVADEVYFFRKEGTSRKLTTLMLQIRKVLRALSSGLYSRLLTDHCIALVRSQR